MVGKRQAVREDLTQRLLEAATKRIRDNGLDGLRTRDITNDAGCGLGTIYKCFADIDELIIRVNSGTLLKLTHGIEKAAGGIEDPREKIQAMAGAYLDFATRNTRLWSALFDHRMPEGVPVPQWHLAEHNVLLGFVMEPLSRLQPTLSEEALQLRTRSVFAAVHGVVSMSLEDRFVGVRKKVLRAELYAFVDILVSGMQSSPES